MRRDPIIGKVIERVLTNERPGWQKISAEGVESNHYWSWFDSLEIRNNILCHKFDNHVRNKITWQILLPISLRKTVLSQT